MEYFASTFCLLIILFKIRFRRVSRHSSVCSIYIMKRHSIVEIAANVLQLLSDTISPFMDVSCSLTWVGGPYRFLVVYSEHSKAHGLTSITKSDKMTISNIYIWVSSDILSLYQQCSLKLTRDEHQCLYLIEKYCTSVGSPLYVFMFTDHKCIMKATSIQHIYSNKLELWACTQIHNFNKLNIEMARDTLSYTKLSCSGLRCLY